MTAGVKSGQLVVVTAVLSALSVFGVGYLGYRSTTAGVDVRREEISLEQDRFDAEERARFEDALSELIPLILDSDQGQREAGLATLFTLYPDRAEEVLTSMGAALTEARVDAIKPAIDRITELQRTAGDWRIVAASDRTAEAAETELNRARSLGYSPTLYQRGEWFATTIGPFQSRGDADRSNIAIRRLMRQDSYVVNLHTWCTSKVQREGFVECVRRE